MHAVGNQSRYEDSVACIEKAAKTSDDFLYISIVTNTPNSVLLLQCMWKLILEKNFITVPGFLLVLSCVFQNPSLVYPPNEPHLVQALELTKKSLKYYWDMTV